MQISLSVWQSLRPPSLKGGDTEKRILAFLALPETLDPVAARANLAACEALAADLEKRLTDAIPTAFYSESEHRKWVEARQNGRKVAPESPQMVGERAHALFTQTVSRWISAVAQATEDRRHKLAQAETLLASALAEHADALLQDAILHYKGKVLTPLQQVRRDVEAAHSPLERRQLIAAASQMLDRVSGPWRRCREGTGFQDAMIDHCKRKFGFALAPALLPPGSWRDDLNHWHQTAEAEIAALSTLTPGVPRAG